RRGLLLEGVLLGDGLAEHGPEGHPEPGHGVPQLLLEGLGPSVRTWLRRHQVSSPASLERVVKVSGAAAPRPGPPAGIGGTGKPPAKASSPRPSSARAWSPTSSPPLLGSMNAPASSTMASTRPITR